MDIRIGIVVPTKARCRFLPKMIRQLQSQTYAHWHCVVVCDGFCKRLRPLFEKYIKGDTRWMLIEREVCANDWGYTPRGDGLTHLQNISPPLDYVLFWDDDNSFHSDALCLVCQAVEQHPAADLVLVPILSQRDRITPHASNPDALPDSEVDTASFVLRLDVALKHYWGDAAPGLRGTDSRLFRRIRDAGCRIGLADVPPIGRYDGLRPLSMLRWRLGVPPLGLSERPWFKPLRRLLRG